MFHTRYTIEFKNIYINCMSSSIILNIYERNNIITNFWHQLKQYYVFALTVHLTLNTFHYPRRKKKQQLTSARESRSAQRVTTAALNPSGTCSRRTEMLRILLFKKQKSSAKLSLNLNQSRVMGVEKGNGLLESEILTLHYIRNTYHDTVTHDRI